MNQNIIPLEDMLNRLETTYSDANTTRDTLTEEFEPELADMREFMPTRVMRLVELHYTRLLSDVIQRSNSRDNLTRTYLVQNSTTELYKIGRTTKPLRTRVAQFEGMSAGDCSIVGSVEKDIENELHYKFSSKRVKGEWFRLSENDVEDILDRFSMERESRQGSLNGS